MRENTDTSVVVEIYGETYRLRGQDPDYINRLASVVDAKMRLVAAQGHTVDSLRVAVLSALNIADELAAAEERLQELNGNLSETQKRIHTRASSLNGLLDSLLTEERKIG